MTNLLPRIVLVTRETEYAALLAHHGTRGQARFFLSTRGQSLDDIAARDLVQVSAIEAVKRVVPADWSFAHVLRDDLNRFLFFPNDIVVALGQDGLVPNIAKYLDGQPVIGVTPDPDASEGVLTTHATGELPGLLLRVANKDADTSERTMVCATLAGGDRLLALNEIFIGHRSHQSARYEIAHDGTVEFQSSSGLIVSTGTGMSGWARSIMAATGVEYDIAAGDRCAAFFVREPWPSRTSGASLRSGLIADESALSIRSRINEGGVVFADGIEQDFLAFDWGSEVSIDIAEKRLTLAS